MSASHKATQVPSRLIRERQAKRKVVPNAVPYMSDVSVFISQNDVRPDSPNNTQVHIPVYVSRDRTYSCSHCSRQFGGERDASLHVLQEHIRVTYIFEVLDWVEEQRGAVDLIIPEWLFLDKNEQKAWRRTIYERERRLRQIAATHHSMHEESCQELLRRAKPGMSMSQHKGHAGSSTDSP